MSHSEQRDQRVTSAAASELREAIADKQITLTELSNSSGIPRSTLTRKVRGEGDLTITELVRLAIALDVPAAGLLGVAVEAATPTRDTEVDRG